MDLTYGKAFFFHSLAEILGHQIASFSGHLDQENLLILAETFRHGQTITGHHIVVNNDRHHLRCYGGHKWSLKW